MTQTSSDYWPYHWAAANWHLFVSDAVHLLGATTEYTNQFVTKVSLQDKIVVWDGVQPKLDGQPLTGGPKEWLQAIQN